MKRTLLTIISILFTFALQANITPQEKQLTAVFSYATFYHPETGSYLESYISFDAWNLNYVKTGNSYQATVEVLLTVSKGDSIELVKKYDLHSPKISSPDPGKTNFLDVKRLALGNGIHQLDITLKDKNSDNAPTKISQQVAFYYDKKKTAMSSLQLMSAIKPTTETNILSRNGYDMEPYVNDFYPEQINELSFYYELYNINRETRDDYVYAVSFIEIAETGKVLEATQSIDKLESAELIPAFGSIDISNLPSGNYNIVVEIRNHQNDMFLYRRMPFIRSNPKLATIADNTPVSMTFASRLQNESQLNDYIEALAPICNEAERRDVYDLIKKPGIEEKQIFLYRFWQRRNPMDPESSWREYRERIDYVNANFTWPKADFKGTKTKGIHTDRGRVYLQYGAPNFVRDEKNFVSIRYMGGGLTIHSSDEHLTAPSVSTQGQIFYLPYQIWRYDNIPGEDPTRCFIFWDEFRSGFYKLLHSNVRSEVHEAGWERRLSQQQLPEGMQGEVGDQFDRGY